jgi:hypothetical protein
VTYIAYRVQMVDGVGAWSVHGAIVNAGGLSHAPEHPTLVSNPGALVRLRPS